MALSLRCVDCGAQLRSVKEAQDHGEATGHSNFEESVEAVLTLVREKRKEKREREKKERKKERERERERESERAFSLSLSSTPTPAPCPHSHPHPIPPTINDSFRSAPSAASPAAPR